MPEKYDAASYKYFDTYPFTREQANEIYDVLKRNFDSEQIDRFIDEIRDCCEGATCLIHQMDNKTFQNNRISMMRILEKSRDLLDEIRKDRGICQFSTYSRLLDNDIGKLGYECQELAVTTGNLLSVLIQKLKEVDGKVQEHRKKGHPTADSMGIVREIADRWARCFGKKPTKYMGGPFADVVKIILEGLNMSFQYPEKKIRDTLK